jgi:hypothetical protein
LAGAVSAIVEESGDAIWVVVYGEGDSYQEGWLCMAKVWRRRENLVDEAVGSGGKKNDALPSKNEIWLLSSKSL